jgi:hypothetical protein
MQPSKRTKSLPGNSDRRAGKRHSAEIISLEEWRVRRHRQGFRWRPVRPVPVLHPRLREYEPRRRHVPVEAWLMILILVSATAGAVFALMGLGYLP